MPKVHLVPSGKVVIIDENTSLLDGLAKNGIQLKSICGGVASCACCKVKVLSGEENLSPMEAAEKKLLGNVFHITHERLACQTTIIGPVTLDISAHQDIRVVPKSIRIKRREDLKSHKDTDQGPPLKTLKELAANQKDTLAQQPPPEHADAQWFKHWEKESVPKGQKKLGGGRRPKFFKTEESVPQEPPRNSPKPDSRPVKKFVHPRKKRSR